MYNFRKGTGVQQLLLQQLAAAVLLSTIASSFTPTVIKCSQPHITKVRPASLAAVSTGATFDQLMIGAQQDTSLLRRSSSFVGDNDDDDTTLARTKERPPPRQRQFPLAGSLVNLRWAKQWLHRWQIHHLSLHSFRRYVLRLGVALLLAFSTLAATPACWATSGGRMGGSFKSSSSTTRTSSSMGIGSGSTTSQPWQFQRVPSSVSVRIGARREPRIRIHHYHSSSWWPKSYERSSASCAPYSGFKPADVALLAVTGALMVKGFKKHHRRRLLDGFESPLSGPLGPGATSASITVSLDVKDRRDPNGILAKLERWAQQHDMSEREQVQQLIYNVALELLRQEPSIVSALTSSRHFPSADEARRDFNLLSVRNRSKFDRETVSAYGGQVSTRHADPPLGSQSPRTTKAVITISLAIEGDSTRLPEIRTRQDLIDSLSRVAADSMTEDCLVSGEILWAPDDPAEQLHQKDVYADYPRLVPI